eukprot:m51a1_g6717 putative endoribonuclease dicer homolog 2-like (1320) ;mRNA; f:149259-153463
MQVERSPPPGGPPAGAGGSPADAGLAIASPREYQTELFEQAQAANTICVLPTGAGKTFIAIMLLRAVKAAAARPNMHTLFLVNTIALAEQQAKVLMANTPYKVGCYTGDTTTRKVSAWRVILATKQVLVMTAQIALDMLRHSFLSITSVDLLIFDECHHAVGRHPFNLIMEEFYATCAPGNRPRVLGLTASPVTTMSRLDHEIRALERNLFSRVATSASADRAAAASTAEVIEYYPPSGPFQYEEAMVARAADEDEARHVLYQLGEWGLSKFVDGSFAARVPEKDRLTPKARALIRVLCKYAAESGPGFCCIVFVQRRIVAGLVAEMISAHPETVAAGIKAASMTGLAASGSRRVRPNTAAQASEVSCSRQALERFRSGEVNVIVATSVIEEGIDVRACMLVVRFDRPLHIRQTIQSSGRARKLNAMYVVMAEKDDVATPSLVEAVSVYKSALLEISKENIEREDSEMPLAHDGSPEEVYEVAPTGAKATLNSAKQLVSRYCALLPHDIYCDMSLLQPRYTFEEDSRKLTLTLPMASAVRTVELAVEEVAGINRRTAQCRAALRCVAQLHKAGALDDRLLPAEASSDESASISDEKDTEEVARDALTGQAPVPQALCADFEDDSPETVTGYAYIVSDSLHVIALLPAILDCSVAQCYKRLSFDKKMLRFARQFTTFALRKKSKGGAVDWEHAVKKYVLVPVLSVDPFEIDYDALRRASVLPDVLAIPLVPQGKRAGPDLDLPSDSVVFCEYKKWALYSPLRMRTDLTPLSPFPEGSGNFKTFADYLLKKYEIVVKDPGQPMLEAYRATQSPMWPSRSASKSDETEGEESNSQGRTAFLVPEVCKVHPMSIAVIAECESAVPLALHKLEWEDTAVLQFKRATSPLKNVPTEMVIKALTSPGTNIAENYDRLEFLGDTSLKVLATATLWLSHPSWHEGQISRARVRIVSNKNLARHVLKLGIHRFILVNNPQSEWLCPGYSNPAPNAAPDGYKLYADVAEALAGACLLPGGEPNKFSPIPNWELAGDFFRWIGLPLIKPSAMRLLLLTYKPRVAGDCPTVSEVEPVQKIVGYQFKRPGLLVEALTHASSVFSTACYERLEILGDALLDSVVTWRLYSSFPDAPASRLSDMRNFVVENDSLAWLATVKGLQKYLRHFSEGLTEAIGKYHESLDKTGFTTLARGPPPCGATEGAPKAVADIVEAICGAVFIDTCGDMKQTALFIESLVQPLLAFAETAPSDPIRAIHERVQHMFGDKWRLKEHFSFDTDQNPDGSWRTTVRIEGKAYAECKASTKQASRRAAAVSSLELLGNQKQDEDTPMSP